MKGVSGGSNVVHSCEGWHLLEYLQRGSKMGRVVESEDAEAKMAWASKAFHSKCLPDLNSRA